MDGVEPHLAISASQEWEATKPMAHLRVQQRHHHLSQEEVMGHGKCTPENSVLNCINCF